MNVSALKSPSRVQDADMTVSNRVSHWLSRLTVRQKIGQLRQVDAGGDALPEAVAGLIREGRIGSVINQSNPAIVAELQRIAREESPTGLPLLVARDVIHGFKTIFPIPLGQAASWNPSLVEEAARHSAIEASAAGINWTFAPMIDISRDARWGRIAESFGEDPYLTTRMGQAMVRGLQTDDLSHSSAVAACAKHFVGYGASEAGRDYNTTNLPPNELHNVYLPPFRGLADIGIASFMSSFSDLDGIPATANEALLRGVLRDAWGYGGLVISDWNAIIELCVHGLCEDHRDAALAAALAGVDMEMASNAYEHHLEALIDNGQLAMSDLDRMVGRVLALKDRLGLLDGARAHEPGTYAALAPSRTIGDVAYAAAVEGAVLLQNRNHILPLCPNEVKDIAIIGPLSDAPYEQLGTWVFDGDATKSQTPLFALQARAGAHLAVHYARGLAHSRARDTSGFDEAFEAAKRSDIVLLFLGEESILSGEAHSRADIALPGAQNELIEAVKIAGKPMIAVIMAGRPLTIGGLLDDLDGVFFAAHGGTMAGPALIDLIFGAASPVGRLPVSFPKSVGQIPVHYNHKNTGRPPQEETSILIDDIEEGARQTSLGMTAYHLDDGYRPLFPFGFGLSYGTIEYGATTLSSHEMTPTEPLTVSVTLTNPSAHDITETVQLYVRDCVGSLTRPVKELKGFQRVHLAAGATQNIAFELKAEDLAFHTRSGEWRTEPGRFLVGIGRDSAVALEAEFTLIAG